MYPKMMEDHFTRFGDELLYERGICNTKSFGDALVNASPNDFDAKWNYWGVDTEEGVESVIYHQPDCSVCGFVTFTPFLTSPAAPSLPRGIPIVKEELEQAPPPTVTVLYQNYPNSFNPDTWIPYQLSESAKVMIEIYDMHGRLIRVLRLGEKSPGVYMTKDKAAHWDGRLGNGEQAASGMYFYRFVAGEFIATRKMVLMK